MKKPLTLLRRSFTTRTPLPLQSPEPFWRWPSPATPSDPPRGRGHGRAQGRRTGGPPADPPRTRVGRSPGEGQRSGVRAQVTGFGKLVQISKGCRVNVVRRPALPFPPPLRSLLWFGLVSCVCPCGGLRRTAAAAAAFPKASEHSGHQSALISRINNWCKVQLLPEF